MSEFLFALDPKTVALCFLAAYAYCWFLVTQDALWLFTSSALCVLFYRFTVSLSDLERATIPPLSFLCMGWHVLCVFLSLFNKAR